MKNAFTLIAAAALILASTSCDKHAWDETKGLHEGMHKAHGEHGEDHAKDDHAPRNEAADKH